MQGSWGGWEGDVVHGMGRHGVSGSAGITNCIHSRLIDESCWLLRSAFDPGFCSTLNCRLCWYAGTSC